ncbi:MAG: Hsp20/alpha crystallin family protein [Betaproteobacteria bacterium]
MFFTPVMRRAAYAPNLRGVDHQLERWLGEALVGPAAQRCAAPASVTQDDKAFTLSFDLPGVTKEHLSIGIEGHVARIESLPEAPRSYKFAYELPQEIDVGASEAKLENGVLTLKLGKLVPAVKRTQLTIA